MKGNQSQYRYRALNMSRHPELNRKRTYDITKHYDVSVCAFSDLGPQILWDRFRSSQGSCPFGEIVPALIAAPFYQPLPYSPYCMTSRINWRRSLTTGFAIYCSYPILMTNGLAPGYAGRI
jgi:hypothetical protein